MRAHLVVGAVVGVILAAHAGTLRGGPGKETKTARIARLIEQLGDNAFARREAASKELEAIGVPALAALRKAAASSDDAEIRWRAKRISARVAEAAARSELAKLQGVWTVVSYEVEGKQLRGKDKRSTMTVTEDRWIAKWSKDDGGVQIESGILKIVNPEKSPLAIDFVHLDGPHKGSTVFAIARVDRATFRFCYRDRAEARPTAFVTKAGDARCGLVTFNHQKK
jgi:uncharacterized protein (TIGR03067 family)